MSDSEELWDLLAEPVIDQEEPRPRHWSIPAFVAALGAAVLVGFWAFGQSTTPTTTAPPVAGVDVGDSIPADPTSTTGLPVFEYPGMRFNASMVFDGAAYQIVMLGGRESVRSDPLLEAWSFDGATGTWSPIDAVPEPPEREMAAATFSSTLGEVIVVGGAPVATNVCGLGAFVNNPLRDVWTLKTDRAAWVRVAAGDTGPPPRWGQSVAWLPDRQQVLVFGGVSIERGGVAASTLGDTWLFDVGTGAWMEVDTPEGPPDRACAGLVFDPQTNRAYLWGGQEAMGRGDASLWAFHPETLSWEEIPTEGGPVPRWSATMVYEPTSGLIYVIGGYRRITTTTDSGSTTDLRSTDEVWELDPATLTWRPRAPLPAPILSHAAAHDGYGRIIVYVGRTTLAYDTLTDTWADLTPWDRLEASE